MPAATYSAGYAAPVAYSAGYAPATYTTAYAPAYTTAYAPAYTTAYAPAYTTAYAPAYDSGWYPGRFARSRESRDLGLSDDDLLRADLYRGLRANVHGRVCDHRVLCGAGVQHLCGELRATRLQHVLGRLRSRPLQHVQRL